MKIILLKPILLALMALTCALASCSAYAPSETPEDNAYFYDESTGKVYTDLSGSFDLKVESWKYYYDVEAKQDRILLSVLIKNKTNEAKKNFICVVAFNERAGDLIASGITRYDINEPYDLPAKTGGMGCANEMLVTTDELLNEIGANKAELLEIIRNVTLEMTWDGGQETITLDCGELKYEE